MLFNFENNNVKDNIKRYYNMEILSLFCEPVLIFFYFANGPTECLRTCIQIRRLRVDERTALLQQSLRPVPACVKGQGDH
jgi:hypothetical protein